MAMGRGRAYGEQGFGSGRGAIAGAHLTLNASYFQIQTVSYLVIFAPPSQNERSNIEAKMSFMPTIDDRIAEVEIHLIYL